MLQQLAAILLITIVHTQNLAVVVGIHKTIASHIFYPSEGGKHIFPGRIINTKEIPKEQLESVGVDQFSSFVTNKLISCLQLKAKCFQAGQISLHYKQWYGGS